MDVTRIKAQKGLLFGVVDEAIVGAGSVVIKHYADSLVKPTSELWQIGRTPKLTFALSVSAEASLIIEWTNDGLAFVALNPILLTLGANDLSGLHIPGLQVRFSVRSSDLGGTTIVGFIRMEAV